MTEYKSNNGKTYIDEKTNKTYQNYLAEDGNYYRSYKEYREHIRQNSKNNNSILNDKYSNLNNYKINKCENIRSHREPFNSKDRYDSFENRHRDKSRSTKYSGNSHKKNYKNSNDYNYDTDRYYRDRDRERYDEYYNSSKRPIRDDYERERDNYYNYYKERDERYDNQYYNDRERDRKFDDRFNPERNRDTYRERERDRDFSNRQKERENESNYINKYNTSKTSYNSTVLLKERNGNNNSSKTKILLKERSVSNNNNIKEKITSSTEACKEGREIYIKNIPVQIEASELKELLNLAVKTLKINIKEGNPIEDIWIKHKKEMCLAEIRCKQEADNSLLKLNGFEILSKKVEVGKTTYISDNTNIAKLKQITSNTNNVKAIAENKEVKKLIVSHLPHSFRKNEVEEFLLTFGKVKNFTLIYGNDDKTNNEKEDKNIFTGQCIVEFEHDKAYENALAYLDGIVLKGYVVSVRKLVTLDDDNNNNTNNNNTNSKDEVSTNTSSLYSLNNIIQYTRPEDYIKIKEQTKSKVICIKNMFNKNILDDSSNYDKLYDAIKSECKQYGLINRIKIPKPIENTHITGIGKAFVEYISKDGAQFAKENLDNKKIGVKYLEVVYHPEESFNRDNFE